MGTKRNMSRGDSESIGTFGALSCGAPGRAEGGRIWGRGEPANELRKARTKAQRDDLTSVTKLQAGSL